MWFEPPEFLVQHSALLFCSFSIFILVVHFSGKSRQLMPLIVLLSITAGSIFIVLSYNPKPVALSLIIAILFLYGAVLFVWLSDALLGRLGRYLTNQRGEKWTKEMDYFYLAIGVLGILASVNRIEFVTSRFERSDILAPLFLVTAVVIRLIKTRAEIGGWNRP
jgi:uncharacterized membrane protein